MLCHLPYLYVLIIMHHSSDQTSLIQAFHRAGQGQVFDYFDALDAAAQVQLVAQASSIDLIELNALVQTQLKQAGDAQALGLERLSPAPYAALPAHGGDPAQWQAAWEAGAAAIAAGRVAAFTVAGGQGTRLGHDGPKGTYPVTPVSNKTLFQVFAEKIGRSGARFGVTIPWFILTSEINYDATVAVFEESDFFGLNTGAVHFVVQGLMPAVDYEGKILLTEKSKIAMTPDGHGGSLRALVRSGAIAQMAALGVDCVSYFQVDNPLVQCIDPAFIGFHVLGSSDMSSKMVPKAYPLEKVGHFCVQEGAMRVVEYSDMPVAMQQAINADGSIRFNAGNIAVHLFDRDFIARVGSTNVAASLPFHRADKVIPFVGADGNSIQPTTANGVKFELFVFDALPLADSSLIIEAARRDEFSPVKNATGVDSPQSCKDDQRRMFARWLQAAGESIETDATGLPYITFEISPLFAVDEADFVAQWAALAEKPVIREGLIIE